VRRQGFTLIELLIVVAIIGILAAIAVPNFLEAQVRAKIARARADIRTVAIALEMYRVDLGAYPVDGAGDVETGEDYDYWHLNHTLTTPIAYLSDAELMVDPFNTDFRTRWGRTYRYKNLDNTWGLQGHPTWTAPSRYYEILRTRYMGYWQMSSDGPDRGYGPSAYRPELGYPLWPFPYNASNGTVSAGDIERSQLYPDGIP